jgi:hypothetical protein
MLLWKLAASMDILKLCLVTPTSAPVELPVPFIGGILVSLGWWKALPCLDRFGELHCNYKAPPAAFGNVANAPISMAGVLNLFSDQAFSQSRLQKHKSRKEGTLPQIQQSQPDSTGPHAANAQRTKANKAGRMIAETKRQNYLVLKIYPTTIRNTTLQGQNKWKDVQLVHKPQALVHTNAHHSKVYR